MRVGASCERAGQGEEEEGEEREEVRVGARRGRELSEEREKEERTSCTLWPTSG